MSTTQLFVELLVIGLGAAVWVSLLADAAAGGRLGVRELWSDKALLLPLVAGAYVIGVVLDRLLWSVFAPMERRFERKYLVPVGKPRWYVERSVAAGNGTLAKDIAYNRSRLRICRAWVVNGAMIAAAAIAWGGARGALGPGEAAAIALAGGAFAAAALYALRRLMADHYRNLRDSYRFLERSGGPGQ